MKHNILYSFRRCPFAMRARWALIKTNHEILIREVNLKKKPVNLLKISPKGTVPVLKTSEGKVIEESIEIMIWAIKKTCNVRLNDDIYNISNKDIFTLINQNDSDLKYHLDRYKYPNRFEGSNTEEHRHKSEVILRKWDKRIKSSNFGLISKRETIADWCIWPFVRQYRLINTSDFDNNKELVNLRTWLNFYLNHSLYSNLMKKYPNWTHSSLDEFLP